MSSEFHYLGHKMPYLPAEGCTGRLIVVEGTDGVGRSTQTVMLKEWLEVQGFAVLDTGWTRSKLVGQATGIIAACLASFERSSYRLHGWGERIRTSRWRFVHLTEITAELA